MPEHEHSHGHSSHGASQNPGASQDSSASQDTNDAIWKSEIGVTFWKSTRDDRERRRGAHRVLMAELLPFAAHEAFTFVDLGAGPGAAARTVMDHYPAARAILADYSAQMMAQGAIELEPYAGRYEYVEFDLTHAGGWPAAIPAQVDAVITSLAVHHVTDARKQELFGEILAHLVPGGWFLNYDPVATSDPVVEEAWHRVEDRRDPSAAHKRSHRSAEEQLRYENHVRYMIPLEPQVAYLRAAGFEGVDVYWKELGYVIYGGRRPMAA
jgi:tRNA (cmo5U34)-methyltransferase